MKIDLNEYKKIIKEITLLKNLEKSPQKKKDFENIEVSFKKGLRSIEIQDKLKNLYYNEQFIAYVCVASQFIEFKIKEIISQSQQMTILLNKNLKLNKNWEKETLGRLIIMLETQCIEDPNLIERLKDFNKLRVKAVHNLFDIKFEIKDVENKIRISMSPIFPYYHSLITPLQNYSSIITIKILETQDKQGKLPQESKMFFEKVYKKMEELNSDLKNKNIEKNLRL